MKKILVAVLVVAIALIGATAVFAAPGHGDVCADCHQPHNAGTVAKLWRNSATGTDGDGGFLTADAKSLFCLSCHAVTVTRGPSQGGVAQNHPLVTNSTRTIGGLTAGTTVQCVSCHQVHNGVDMYVIAGGCQRCHAAGANF